LIPETGWCISECAICDFQWGDGWWARKGDNRWGAATARGLNRDQTVKIARLTGCKNFVGKRKKFIFNAFVDLKPVERFDNESDMWGFRSLNNSTSKRVLDLLEPVKLIIWKVVVERVWQLWWRECDDIYYYDVSVFQTPKFQKRNLYSKWNVQMT